MRLSCFLYFVRYFETYGEAAAYILVKTFHLC